MLKFFKGLQILFSYIKRWLSTTNHKDIGILCLIFGLLLGLIRAVFSVLIRVELAYPGSQILEGDWQLYNVIVTAHAFIMMFLHGSVSYDSIFVISYNLLVTKNYL